MFKSGAMQNLNIFREWESFLFEFVSLNGVQKFGGILLPHRAHQSSVQRVLTARASHWTRAAHHRPGHHAVTAITPENVSALVTAGCHRCPCRGGPYST
jgi:hypothetical protein